jgi:hypothetical protein
VSTHPEKRKLATIMFTDMVVLKLLPYWGPLRGDPRFEKIVASFAPK